MKTLTVVLTLSTLFASSAAFAAETDTLQQQIQADTAKPLVQLAPRIASDARQAMLQTIIDVQARLQAEQDVELLVASQQKTEQPDQAE